MITKQPNIRWQMQEALDTLERIRIEAKYVRDQPGFLELLGVVETLCRIVRRLPESVT